MVPFRPALFRNPSGPWLGQEAPAQPPAAPAPQPAAPPAGFTGGVGVLENLFVLAISAAAAWTGVRAGLREKGLPKYAGWVGGVGSALIGLFYVATKTELAQGYLPRVRVAP
jgi:hypothetical protein